MNIVENLVMKDSNPLSVGHTTKINNDGSIDYTIGGTQANGIIRMHYQPKYHKWVAADKKDYVVRVGLSSPNAVGKKINYMFEALSGYGRKYITLSDKCTEVIVTGKNVSSYQMLYLVYPDEHLGADKNTVIVGDTIRLHYFEVYEGTEKADMCIPSRYNFDPDVQSLYYERLFMGGGWQEVQTF